MMQILKDVKAAVKELTGEDVRNITEAVELLELKNEGTPKEKVHAAAIELGISIFVEVRDFLWAYSSQRTLRICFCLHLTRSVTILLLPAPRMLCNYKSAEVRCT